MKNTIKLISALSLLLSVSAMAQSYEGLTGVVNKSTTGTTSATVVVEPGNRPVELTDLGVRLDNGVTTGLVAIREGDVKYTCTSATSASSTQCWFTNTGTAVGVGEYVIIYDESEGTYSLNRAAAATTTSITVQASISQAMTTSDLIWSVTSSSERPVLGSPSQTASVGSIWLPGQVPTAITVDGNTTACRISISGVRANSK